MSKFCFHWESEYLNLLVWFLFLLIYSKDLNVEQPPQNSHLSTFFWQNRRCSILNHQLRAIWGFFLSFVVVSSVGASRSAVTQLCGAPGQSELRVALCNTAAAPRLPGDPPCLSASTLKAAYLKTKRWTFSKEWRILSVEGWRKDSRGWSEEMTDPPL